MPLISTDVTMNITMVSKKTMEHKPHWISIDSTSLTLPSGKELYFDFENSYGDSDVLENGHVKISMTKYGFDKDHYLDGEDQTLVDLDWEQIANATFTDIYVIGDSTKENFEDLSTDDFTITEVIFSVDRPDSNETTEVILTQKQLDDLNRSIADAMAS